MIHVSKIGCLNIPGMDSHYPRPISCFHAHQCQRFHHVSSPDTAVLWAPPVQPRGCAHQHHHFCPPFCNEIQRCFAWEPQLKFELTPFYISLQLIKIRTAEFDKWWFNVWKPLSHSSHWLRSIQEQDFPLRMSKTLTNSETYCFNKIKRATFATWQRHAPRSRLLNFSRNSLNLTKCKSSQAKTCHIRWTAAIVVIAGEKLFSKRLWRATYVLKLNGCILQRVFRTWRAPSCCWPRRPPWTLRTMTAGNLSRLRNCLGLRN